MHHLTLSWGLTTRNVAVLYCELMLESEALRLRAVWVFSSVVTWQMQVSFGHNNCAQPAHSYTLATGDYGNRYT